MSLLLTQLGAGPSPPVEAVTARVQRWWPAPADVSALYIGMPDTAGLNANLVDEVGHLAGHDLNLIHQQAFGTTESASGTYRFLYQPSLNSRAVTFAFIVYGPTSGAPAKGSLDVALATSTRPLTVAGPLAGNVGAIQNRGFRFIAPISSFGEVTYQTTNVQLHSVCVWEVPRGQLTGTQLHLDRTFSDSRRVITDNPGSSSNPRGYRALLDAIQSLRSNMRRHWSFFVNPGVAVNPAGLSVWASAWDNLRMRARDIKSTASAVQGRWRFFVYVSAITGGTWSVRLRDSTTTDTATITGITTTGWKPGTASLATGQAFQMETSADDLVVEAQQTVGADTESITLGGITVIEDPT